MRSRAQFEIVLWWGSDIVVLKDVGPWNMYPTVTNDAEAVIYDLFNFYWTASTGKRMTRSTRVFYYDSEGEPGEIIHGGPTDPVAIKKGSFAFWDGVAR